MHLKEIKIENFKSIDNLELTDLKRVNLILGDNNVGKTSVLEAMLIDENAYKTLLDLSHVISNKVIVDFIKNNIITKINYLDFFLKKESGKNIRITQKNTNLKESKIELGIQKSNSLTETEFELFTKSYYKDNTQNIPQEVVFFKRNEEVFFYHLNLNLHQQISDDSEYSPFIRSGISYGTDLVQFYSENFNKKPTERRKLFNSLHFISQDIEELIIDTTTLIDSPILMVLFNDGKEPLPLFMFGDGTIRLIRILMEIAVCKDRRLHIDELDNGFHHSKMKEVWRVVLKASKLNNTQLFITTHSAECLRTLKEVLTEEENASHQDEVTTFTLFKNRDGLVDSVNYNFAEFEHAIDYSLNIRG